MTRDLWEAEFERDGRVVLPPRRRAYVVHLLLASFLTFTNGSRTLTAIRDGRDWGLWEYANVILFAVFGSSLIVVVSTLVRRKPVVTIDRRGIAKGDQSVTWNQVGDVELKMGGAVVLTTDDKPLRIDGKHTDNASGLAYWLQSLVERYRIR